MAIEIGLVTTFLGSWRNLDSSVGSKVLQTIDKFCNNPEGRGLNLEKLNNDFWSIRVDQAYRIILHRKNKDKDFMFVWVDHHDDAYRWANSHSVDHNQSYTQIIDNNYIKSKKPVTSGLYSHLTDNDFERLAIPETMYSAIRSIKNKAELAKHKSYLHPSVFESLRYLTDQSISVYEIIEMQSENNSNAGDVESVDKSELLENHQNIVRIKENEDLLLLEKALNDPLNEWRLFLHPSQKRLVEGEFRGPVKVLGGAGTGKTVVIVHRAKYLASKNPTEKILVTTFTRNLSADIKKQIKSICTKNEFNKIEIRNIDNLIFELFYQFFPEWTLSYDDEKLTEIWESCLKDSKVSEKFSVLFLQEEWERIIIPQNIQSVQDYFLANRRGRGVGISRKNKVELWEVFSNFKMKLNHQCLADTSYAIDMIIQALDQGKIKVRYSSVLVDEMQDFDNMKLKLLRKCAGEQHQNDMFLVGDSQQKIYRKEVILKHCDITIASNRSFKLNINYRTTEENRSWAYGLFKDELVDDLDGSFYEEQRYISLTTGPKPKVLHFDNFDQEMEKIVEMILDLEGNFRLEDICLTFRTTEYLKKYKRELEDLDIRCYEIKASSSSVDSLPGIRMATLHRVKGLEFDHMIICAVNDGMIPRESVINRATDLVMKKEIEASERNLLYVAATRARKTLSVFSHGKKSRYLI
ncbi:MAG: ATP-dependent helicase [Clostridiaceae bacterium]|nr:ATP-dependent helicase [Clostridiaceae bacterium]